MEAHEPSSAEELINRTVASVEGSSVVSALSRGKEALAAGERASVERYIQAMRPIYAAMLVDDFGGNTAGLYDGSSISIDRRVAMVDASVDTTVDRAREVYEHERYHQRHRHTEPLAVMADTREDIAAVIGGVAFTETALVEGLTVARTGDSFVSAEYGAYKQNLLGGIARAGLNIADVERAVNDEKDLTRIDDRARESSDASSSSSHALAA